MTEPAPAKINVCLFLGPQRADGRHELVTIFQPIAVQETAEVQMSAAKLDHEVVVLEVRRAEDIAGAFESLKGRTDALYVCGDLLTFTNRIRINTFAQSARVASEI